MTFDTALVTGGAGFMGSHVAREVSSIGIDVVVLDDLSGGYRDNLRSNAVFVEGDINDRGLVKRLFGEYRFRYVYHLAAYAAENLSHFVKHFNYTNNLLGSINLINAAVNHDVECFVFTSSIAVYGSSTPPMREDMQPRPEDSYGIAKYSIEQELAATNRMFGLPYVILRPHNVYGPGQNIGDRYGNVVGIFLNCIMQKQPMPIFGTGEQTRAFSYIDDVAPRIAACPTIPGAINDVFNVGADEPCTVNELSEVVAAAMNVPHQVEHFESREEVLHAFASHEKFRKTFHAKATVSLSEGVRRMAAWARACGPRNSKPFEGIEIVKNLPTTWRSEFGSGGNSQ